jgi:hypothetical protein
VSDPTLIIMAGGIGNRYGGLKQVEPVGPGGEILIDYSIYDAMRAGFGKVIFLIRREIEDIFRQRVGQAVEGRVVERPTFTRSWQICRPAFLSRPGAPSLGAPGMPYCRARMSVDGPFGVINADDFYGPGAFEQLAAYLRGAQDRSGVYDYCMVGYVLANTLSEHGSVARGVCEVSPDGYLQKASPSAPASSASRTGSSIRPTARHVDPAARRQHRLDEHVWLHARLHARAGGALPALS